MYIPLEKEKKFNLIFFFFLLLLFGYSQRESKKRVYSQIDAYFITVQEVTVNVGFKGKIFSTWKVGATIFLHFAYICLAQSISNSSCEYN